MTRFHNLAVSLLALVLFCWSAPGQASECPDFGGSRMTPEQVELAAARLADTPLVGLARYFAGHETFVLRGGEWSERDTQEGLEGSCALAIVGRFETLVVTSEGSSPGRVAAFSGESFAASAPLAGRIVANEALDGPLAPLRYSQVWWVLKPLVLAGEWLVELPAEQLRLSWGLAIIGLALAMRILLLPVSRFTAAAQAKVDAQDARLRPVLEEIRRVNKGEEAHLAVLAAHKELGIPSTYRINPVLGALIQIPFLVAIFHLLGLMPQLDGQGFLWIADLGLPDAIARLPVAIPGMGDAVSLLPFAMAASMIASGLLAVPRDASQAESRRRRRNALLAAIAFLLLLLLYPFPAALLLYWTATNVLQIVERQIGSRGRE